MLGKAVKRREVFVSKAEEEFKRWAVGEKFCAKKMLEEFQEIPYS